MCGSAKVYDYAIYDAYSLEEIQHADKWIDHDRDFLFTYAGLRQVVDKYLVQDRSTGQVYETPQFMYMMIALTMFAKYPKGLREWITFTDTTMQSPNTESTFPHLSWRVRTPLRQFANCVLVDVDDTLDSIFTSDMAIGRYVAQRAGIGINAGRIRGINAKIRGGEVQHTGVVPFLKKFESTVRCCTQNGIRGGSATVHFPIWHQEIEDIIVLKTTKERRITVSENLITPFNSQNFSTNVSSKTERFHFSLLMMSPIFYDAFGTDRFDDLYCKYESDDRVPRKTVGAQELILDLLKERAETGRIYIMNIDHCNTHSSFKDKVEMSNLCQEITLPTYPLQHIDDEGAEIALCILSAINVGKIRDLSDLEELCDLAVRGLEELIDYQEYPIKAERATKARRSLGVGFIGLAHYLAKVGYKYSDPDALVEVHRLTEGLSSIIS